MFDGTMGISDATLNYIVLLPPYARIGRKQVNTFEGPEYVLKALCLAECHVLQLHTHHHGNLTMHITLYFMQINERSFILRIFFWTSRFHNDKCQTIVNFLSFYNRL